ncbi:hypothetical protein [Pseudomonas sp. K8]|uniref:hypothetical protein n=1 Tax=Pseudomonas sp. K8 TaxID=212200 RepID=UPI00186657A8|nr:hypothetical protein [Pseudomonas sp. K8]
MPLVRHAAVGVNWVNRLEVPALVPEAGKQTEKNSLQPPLNSRESLDLKPPSRHPRIQLIAISHFTNQSLAPKFFLDAHQAQTFKQPCY